MSENIIEWEAHYKDEFISGYIDMDDVDLDYPLHFYDNLNQISERIPSNPYKNPVNHKMLECEMNYDTLICVFERKDIVQILSDYSLIENKTSEDKKVVLDNVKGYDIVLTMD